MIVTNTYKCNNMFKKNVKCIPTKCKPTFQFWPTLYMATELRVLFTWPVHLDAQSHSPRSGREQEGWPVRVSTPHPPTRAQYNLPASPARHKSPATTRRRPAFPRPVFPSGFIVVPTCLVGETPSAIVNSLPAGSLAVDFFWAGWYEWIVDWALHGADVCDKTCLRFYRCCV